MISVDMECFTKAPWPGGWWEGKLISITSVWACPLANCRYNFSTMWINRAGVKMFTLLNSGCMRGIPCARAGIRFPSWARLTSLWACMPLGCLGWSSWCCWRTRKASGLRSPRAWRPLWLRSAVRSRRTSPPAKQKENVWKWASNTTQLSVSPHHLQ